MDLSSILIFSAYILLQAAGVFRLFATYDSFFPIPQNLLISGISVFIGLYIIGVLSACQTLASVKKNLSKNYPDAFSIVK